MIPQDHIVFLCSRLDLPGGIERAIVNTANLFTGKGHKITLLILDETSKCFYPLDPSVKSIQLPLSFGITQEGNPVTRKIRLLSDVLKLRKLLKQLKPSLVIATEYPFAAAAVLSGAKSHGSLVSWEHHHAHELKRNLFWNKIFNYTYPRLDGVICLNESERNIFKKINAHAVAIPNFIKPGTPSLVKNKRLLSIGRLTHVKGTDLLLQAAKTVLKEYPDWEWKLIGDGDMKENVLQFIEKEKLQDRLILQDPVDHAIQQEYTDASVYVMCSRNECFPMTLLEAQSNGLPCISFDCESGPRHIIHPGKDGLLVEKENITALADAISLLIEDTETRTEMGKHAFTGIGQYAPEKIYALWKQTIFT